MRYYQVRYVGWNHSGILSEKQLSTDAKGERLNPDTMTKENLYTCNACLNGEPGYCSESVLHPIDAARKLSPLEVFQVMDIRTSGSGS
jgi:hypothetical protein